MHARTLIQHLKTVPCLLLATLLCTQLYAADKLTMNMRDADIRALIQWVADNTGKNIVVHKDVQGKVTVLSPQPVTPDEAYQVFLSVLQVHGYAAIETAQALKIVPKTIATNSGLPANRSALQDMVVSIIKVNHISAEKLSQSLKPLLSSNALLTPYPQSNSLVIADHHSNIQQIKQLVAQLDDVGNQAIDVIKLQYANAKDVMETLKGLLPKQGKQGDGVSLSLDERSNSILLAATAVKREKIKALIAKLDTPLSGDGNTQVIYLHYVDAEEIAPILKNLAQTMEKEQKAGTMAISVEASKSSNALVLKAPPAILNSMKRVVEQLDIRRAQVLIESMIVEVGGDVSEDLGVTWLATDLNSNDTGFAGGVVTPGSLGTTGPGLSLGYLQGGDIQAAIRALNTNTRANILSTPTIVALDNEQASLLVGQNVPFITGQSTGSSSSTDDPFTTIERQDIGITLDVTPRINQGDSVTLQISQKTEDIVTSGESLKIEGASDIITNKREIITTALIEDDQVLVLGGLISDDEEESVQKVPFLGDLPLVGNLFKSTSKTREKKNLMVFIHPVILKDRHHSDRMSEQRYKFMRELQMEARQRPVNFDPKQPLTEEFNTFSPVSR
jgi:general secretion pathway protein D